MKPNGRALSRVSRAESESADSSFGTARNRRTRTRMSGGVGGGRSILPPTRLDDFVHYSILPGIRLLLPQPPAFALGAS